ncbi:MAG: hypothetical protein R2704_11870 [Microthrixaceae bacterium]
MTRSVHLSTLNTAGLVRWTPDGALEPRPGLDVLGSSVPVDIAALQEVEFPRGAEGSVTRHPDGWVVVGSPQSDSPHTAGWRMGTATAVRGEVLDLREVPLPNPNWTATVGGARIRSHDRALLAVQARVRGITLWVVNLHHVPFRRFGTIATDPEASAIWSELRHLVSSLPGPVLVAGDFNCTLAQRQTMLEDVWASFASSLNGRPTRPTGGDDDDILVPKDFGAVDVTIRPCGSDHFVCDAIVELPEGAP